MIAKNAFLWYNINIGIEKQVESTIIFLGNINEAISSSYSETTETADISTNTTPETAVADYNYIYFRHSNQWVTNKLICYEVVDNGQNIKFSAENSAGDTLSYYTNMANVVLMYRNEN